MYVQQSFLIAVLNGGYENGYEEKSKEENR
jgi:hypothetical protein